MNKRRKQDNRVPNKLDADMQIECQWCDSRSTVTEWDDATYKECKNRESKKRYIKLYNTKTFNREEGTVYKCPKCGKWSEAPQLILLTDNKFLRRLGGKPLVNIE